MLQLLLTAFDHKSQEVDIWSELGTQLLIAQTQEVIHPQIFKQLIQKEINESQIHAVQQNIVHDYQGARHFLNILRDNNYAWPDLFGLFQHTTQQIITCTKCQYQSVSEEVQHLYHEMQVPPNKSKLKNYVQSSIDNEVNVDEYRCINGCEGPKIKQFKFLTFLSSPHIIIVLSLNPANFKNEISFTEDITIIDSDNVPNIYEFLAVVQFHERKKHYTCDLKSQADGKYYHTDDMKPPKMLDESKVTKHGFVALYKKK